MSCARAALRTGAPGGGFSASVPGLNESEEVNETRERNKDRSNTECLLCSEA